SLDGDDEAFRVDDQFLQRARQQPSFLEVRGDQGVQLLRLRRVGGAKRDASRLVHARPPTAPSAASSRSSASLASASVMTKGGSNRTTVSAVRLTMTPRSSP